MSKEAEGDRQIPISPDGTSDPGTDPLPDTPQTQGIVRGERTEGREQRLLPLPQSDGIVPSFQDRPHTSLSESMYVPLPENYRDGFPAVVARTKKTNTTSARIKSAWSDPIARKDRIHQLRETWRAKHERANREGR